MLFKQAVDQLKIGIMVHGLQASNVVYLATIGDKSASHRGMEKKKKEKIVAHTVKNSRDAVIDSRRSSFLPVENLEIIHPSILVNRLVTGSLAQIPRPKREK